MTTTKAAETGTRVGAVGLSLDDKYRKLEGPVLLTGVQALVRLVLDQVRADRAGGLHTAAFVSGYPGSPLGGFDLALSRTGPLLDQYDVRWVPGVNEDLAATAVWGSQQDHMAPLARHDGVIGLWYGKSPGVDRTGDVFRHANFHGTGRNGGVVCAAGDDPTSKSSTLPSSSHLAFYDAMIPVLVPGSSQEILDLGRHAYEMSRMSGCWTALQIVTTVADGFGTADVTPERLRIQRPHVEIDGRAWVHVQKRRLFVPESLEMERELAYLRHQAVKAYARENGVNRIEVDPAEAWIGIIAAGRTYREVREALASLGLAGDALSRAGVRLLRLGMTYPLEEEIVLSLAQGVEEVLVVEEKRSFVEHFVREILYGRSQQPRLVGKRDEQGRVLVPADGELTADRLQPLLEARLRTRLSSLAHGHPGGARPAASLMATPAAHGGREPTWPRPVQVSLKAAAAAPTGPVPARTAHFCSGCPHNRSTVDVSGSPVGGGVGCHAMVLWMDRGVTTYTHMGGEGAQWIGRSPFTDTPHLVQNMGDGTFFHSGSMAVRAAVAAGVNITFKILYNGVVAMTGGQVPPGQMTVPQLCSSLLVEGVRRIVVCSQEPGKYGARGESLPDGVTLWGRDRLERAERELASTPGVTVLVYDQECAAELRRLRKRGRAPQGPVRVVINEAVCEGCGDCGRKSACLSVQPVDTEFGRKTRIDQSSCNTDYSCLDGDCPSFVTVRNRPQRRHTRWWPAVGSLLSQPDSVNMTRHLEPPKELPTVPASGFNLYLAGVGGTGVVTVNQVVATAALLEGLNVTGLDQTGLSQKGGPVVSHLRLLHEPAWGSGSVGDGAADCMLALDLLVALDDRNLRRADPSRTVVVASTSVVPTAAMVMDPSVPLPAVSALVAPLRAASRQGTMVQVDAEAVAKAVCGDNLVANVVVLGAALQAGALPLHIASVERALELNGVAVEKNLRALTAGRLAVADPGALLALCDGKNGKVRSARGDARRRATAERMASEFGFGDALGERVTLRAADLVGYQDERLAKRYLRVVADVQVAERRVMPDSQVLTEAVAVNLHRLMAYKDEYEVARLHLRPELRRRIEEEAPGATGLRYRLHPPLLRALGMRTKVALPVSVAIPMFAVLRSMRCLRETPLDPFGLTKIRRTERALVLEYEEVVAEIVANLRPANHGTAVELAELPSMVRGYEEIKLAAVERFRTALAERRAELTATNEATGAPDREDSTHGD